MLLRTAVDSTATARAVIAAVAAVVVCFDVVAVAVAVAVAAAGMHLLQQLFYVVVAGVPASFLCCFRLYSTAFQVCLLLLLVSKLWLYFSSVELPSLVVAIAFTIVVGDCSKSTSHSKRTVTCSPHHK